MSAEVKTKIVDTVTTELTKKIVLLLLPLVSGLVLAIVPQVRDRILPVLPKPLLAVLLGLSLSLNLALFFYVLHLSRVVSRKLKPGFGVCWDRDLTAYCPAHKEIPLGAWGNLGKKGPHGYICPEGPHVLPLQDDERNYLTPEDAKKLLQANATRMPPDAYEPDETDLKILVRLARADGVAEEQLEGFLRLHPQRMRLHLSQLEQREYIHSIWAGVAGAPINYYLSEKARKLLAARNLI